ncbi:MAG: NmrA/HSCARG family protein [Bacteroidetes bacterium]|nr:NmrA/HSCARG family protein [Bacteroidota bacterium]
MSEKKIIAIMGATGAQGGGLADAILSDPASGFMVRAITRDAGSEKARQLAARGAEVVQADVDDQASLEKAFAGAYGAFCVTFYWAHMSPEKELQQARNMALAAKQAGVHHVIWSTLEDTRKWVPLSDDRMPTLMEKYKVPHFDAKGEANAIFTEAGVPTTFMNTAFYWDNLVGFGMGPRRNADGTATFVLPMGDRKLPGIAAVDIGRTAYGVFKAGDEFIGKSIGIAGEHLTGEQMASVLSSTLGEQIGYYAMPFEAYRELGFPGADDLGNMFQFKHDFNDDYVGTRDIATVRRLNPALQTFAQWAEANRNNIKIA